MIKIIIERHLKEGKGVELASRLRELRKAAVHQPGYVTGETLGNTEDAAIITVVTTWRNLEEWKVWEESGERARLEEQIEPLLLEKPRISLYQIMATE